jgi:hypothetical protein
MFEMSIEWHEKLVGDGRIVERKGSGKVAVAGNAVRP